MSIFSTSNDLKRWDVINHYVRRQGSYLEIGVRRGRCIRKVKAFDKVGVDPDEAALNVTHRMTSDEYFRTKNEFQFDVVLIDGLHLEEQVLRDIDGAWGSLNDLGGAIILHDCNPQTEEAQRETYDGKSTWNGTVWRAWVRARLSGKYGQGFVIDADEGLGVFLKGWQNEFEQTDELMEMMRSIPLDWASLNSYRRPLLNLITVEEWKANNTIRRIVT